MPFRWAALRGRYYVHLVQMHGPFPNSVRVGAPLFGGLSENVELRNHNFSLRTAQADLAARIDVLEQPDLAPMADSEPKKIPNPWGRKGKPSSRKIAATAAASPAKKVRTQPARGAVDAAAAVM